MVKQRRTFTREFKMEALRLAEESPEPAAAVARQLGIHPNLLYRWRQELLSDREDPFPGRGNVPADEAELQRLRRELARVREERDILKKAVTFFAKEKP